jgi:hypothetical protein
VIARESAWQERFLSDLRDHGNVRRAAECAGIARSTAYLERERDASFRAKWDEALEDACDLFEDEIRRRAFDGVPNDVYYKGEVVGRELEFSDSLALAYVRAHRPEKWRERIDARHLGPDGGPIQLAAQIDFTVLSDDDLAALETLAAKLAPESGGDPPGAGAEAVRG